MTDKSKPSEADIRKRAHEIWEREGRPQFRDEEHWHKAEAELAAAGPQGNEGEGSKTAALAFDRSQTEFAQQRGLQALDGAEGADLRKAEAAGRARSRGEDPELNRKSGKGPTKRA